MAKGTFTQSTVDVDNVRNMPDVAVDTPTNNKTKFDQFGEDFKAEFNGTHIAELEDGTNDTSGSFKIGHGSTNITADNVGDGLEELKSDITGVVLGQIPDNSLTNAKLGTDIKVGSLASLTTTATSDVVSAINEVDANTDTNTNNLDIARTAKEDSGTADAYVVTTDDTFDYTKDGNRLDFIPTNTNTGASTLNVDGEGVKSIVKPDGAGGTTALEAGDLTDGSPATVYRRVSSDFFLLAPKGGAIIKSVQRINSDFQAGQSSKNHTITAVDQSKTIVKITLDSDASTANETAVDCDLTSATNVNVSRLSSGQIVRYFIDVIEYANAKSKQTGSFVHNLNTENVTITSVDLNKTIVSANFETSASAGDCRAITIGYILTTATNFQFNSDAASSYNKNVKWQVLELT